MCVEIQLNRRFLNEIIIEFNEFLDNSLAETRK
jgi:hypothetical protein